MTQWTGVREGYVNLTVWMDLNSKQRQPPGTPAAEKVVSNGIKGRHNGIGAAEGWVRGTEGLRKITKEIRNTPPFVVLSWLSGIGLRKGWRSPTISTPLLLLLM